MSEVSKAKIDGRRLVRIVSDGAMAGPAADGKLIPVLILDVAQRPDIEELVRQHGYLQHGDAVHEWATSRADRDSVVLVLKFERPSEVDFSIPFSIEHQGTLVDSMIRSGAVYLQPGSEGDRLSRDLNKPKLLVELPDTGFRGPWEDIFHRRMTAVIARRMRASRRRAEPVARRIIAEMREATSFRMGGQG